MHLPRLERIALSSLVVVTACSESAGPKQRVPEPAVSWIEWTAGVTATQADSLRVSGYVQCPYASVWDATVSGTDVLVSGRAYERKTFCLDNGSGAGYDTVLVLPPSRSGYRVFAAMADPVTWDPIQRLVGYIDVWTLPDTTTRFAGIATLIQDSLGCWRVRPWSGSPSPRLALAQPPPLAPTLQQFSAYLAGQLVAGSPPACGDAVALSAWTLEIVAAAYY
jgi:hypothetical protein